MVDISTISYSLYAITSTNGALDITELVSELTWEENEGELASRITFTIANQPYRGEHISSFLKLNCVVMIKAHVGGTSTEVARGKIVTWKTSQESDTDELQITAYDLLYDLQKSEDDRYIAKGTTTETAIKKILSDWKVPVGGYSGPSKKHKKTVFSAQSLGDIITSLLDDAVKDGADKYVIYAYKSKVYVRKVGYNPTIYAFENEEHNIISASVELSTAELVTRVKIYATGSEKSKPKYKATINGKTEYGIRQKVQNKSSGDSLKKAKKEAKATLKENGDVKKTYSLKTPDVPYVRKGHKVYAKTRSMSGFYIVTSIQHDAESRTMSMELKPE